MSKKNGFFADFLIFLVETCKIFIFAAFCSQQFCSQHQIKQLFLTYQYKKITSCSLKWPKITLFSSKCAVFAFFQPKTRKISIFSSFCLHQFCSQSQIRQLSLTYEYNRTNSRPLYSSKITLKHKKLKFTPHFQSIFNIFSVFYCENFILDL